MPLPDLTGLPRAAFSRWSNYLARQMYDAINELEAKPLGNAIELSASEPVPVDLVAGQWLVRVADPTPVLEVVEETATTYFSSGESWTLAVPEDTSTNDWLIATLTHQNSGQTITPPDGNWELVQEVAGTDYRTTEIWGYPVNGVPPSVDQVFTTVGAGRLLGGMFRATGVDLVTPVQVAGATASRTDNVVTVPALVGAAGSLILSVTSVNTGGGTGLAQPLAYDNSLDPFISITTSTDTGVSRTTLDVAWTLAPSDFAEHDVTAANPVSAMGSQVVALAAA